jgi:uncharacterized protein YjcR
MISRIFQSVMALVKIGKAAEMLGVEVQTLRAWEPSTVGPAVTNASRPLAELSQKQKANGPQQRIRSRAVRPRAVPRHESAGERLEFPERSRDRPIV